MPSGSHRRGSVVDLRAGGLSLADKHTFTFSARTHAPSRAKLKWRKRSRGRVLAVGATERKIILEDD
jgi:hypothetical protein